MVKEKFAQGLVGKPEGNGPLGRSSFGWEDNNGMFMEGTGWNGVEWFNLAELRTWTSSGLL